MSYSENRTLSICIPAYEMGGHGDDFLRHSFDVLASQTFKDFDVIISDHSPTDLIKKVCDAYDKKLVIHYVKNTENMGSSSANINNAMQRATGRLIKILFQDDFLYSNDALQTIVDNFDLEKDTWLVTASEHTADGKVFMRPFYPYYNRNILLGQNTLSSPSAVTIKNDRPLLFDPQLKWLMDCDYYYRYYKRFGEPKIITQVTVVNRIGAHQVTNTLATEALRKREYYYIIDTYRYGIRYWWRRFLGIANRELSHE